MNRLVRMLAGSFACFVCALTAAAELPLDKEYKKLDQRIQTIKSSMLGLGQDLSLLDKGMLAFSGNPLVVYLSTDVDDAFELQAVEIEINGNLVKRLELLPDMLSAMQHGGAKRVIVNELPQGDYQMRVTMLGKVGKGREYRRDTVLSFTKENKPKTIELRVSNLRERFLPDFVISEWD